MADLSQYADLNEVYAKFFDAENAPARAAYQVVKLPKDALTEIKCSAIVS
jgi:2-iminobutanoate/2-iminopropanoate deaminase